MMQKLRSVDSKEPFTSGEAAESGFLGWVRKHLSACLGITESQLEATVASYLRTDVVDRIIPAQLFHEVHDEHSVLKLWTDGKLDVMDAADISSIWLTTPQIEHLRDSLTHLLQARAAGEAWASPTNIEDVA